MASRITHHITRVIAAIGAIGVSSNAYAVDIFSGSISTIGTTGSETAITTKVTNASSNVVNLIMGPGMWIVMAIGAVIALFGLAQNQKATLFTGIGIFVFAGVMRALFAAVA